MYYLNKINQIVIINMYQCPILSNITNEENKLCYTIHLTRYNELIIYVHSVC